MFRLHAVWLSLAILAGASLALAASTEEKTGTVESVSGDQLVMTASDAKTKTTYTVPSDATIMLDGKTAKLDELTKGDKVTVKTETNDGKTVVKSVDAKSGAMKAKSH